MAKAEQIIQENFVTSTFDTITLSEWEKATSSKIPPKRIELLEFLKKRQRILKLIKSMRSVGDRLLLGSAFGMDFFRMNTSNYDGANTRKPLKGAPCKNTRFTFSRFNLQIRRFDRLNT